jgi:hypothetical protein
MGWGRGMGSWVEVGAGCDGLDAGCWILGQETSTIVLRMTPKRGNCVDPRACPSSSLYN